MARLRAAIGTGHVVDEDEVVERIADEVLRARAKQMGTVGDMTRHLLRGVNGNGRKR